MKNLKEKLKFKCLDEELTNNKKHVKIPRKKSLKSLLECDEVFWIFKIFSSALKYDFRNTTKKARNRQKKNTQHEKAM